jgi:hypothetical protein
LEFPRRREALLALHYQATQSSFAHMMPFLLYGPRLLNLC